MLVKKKKKIIVFGNQKGGVGKSILAFHCSYYLQKKLGKKCVLLDLNMKQLSCIALNTLRELNGFERLNVIAVDNDKELLDKVESEEYDYVIIDMGGFDTDINRVAIAIADVLITPLNSKTTEILAIDNFISMLDDINNITGSGIMSNFLINRAHPSTKNFKIIEDICSANSNRVVMSQTVIREREVINAALAIGLTVFERGQKEADASINEMENMIKELILN